MAWPACRLKQLLAEGFAGFGGVRRSPARPLSGRPCDTANGNAREPFTNGDLAFLQERGLPPMAWSPLAGGHLGFGMDWAQYDLATIVAEILAWMKAEQLDIPVLPAGGIFTGTDAVRFMEMGASGVQVATRFTVTKECGLPDDIKQEYFKANEDDIEVNEISPTGYPMRMIKSSPGIGDGIRPNCEAYGYLLDANGKCAYITSYNREVLAHPGEKRIAVMDKTCLCTHMRNFDIWTCGQLTWRLKDTTLRHDDGSYQLLSAQHVFEDYQFSVDDKIALPESEFDVD